MGKYDTAPWQVLEFLKAVLLVLTAQPATLTEGL